jgi:hypothetical protein
MSDGSLVHHRGRRFACGLETGAEVQAAFSLKQRGMNPDIGDACPVRGSLSPCFNYAFQAREFPKFSTSTDLKIGGTARLGTSIPTFAQFAGRKVWG